MIYTLTKEKMPFKITLITKDGTTMTCYKSVTEYLSFSDKNLTVLIYKNKGDKPVQLGKK